MTIEPVKSGNHKITGIDVCGSFVETARENTREAGVQIDFQQGDATALRFPDNTFNLIIRTSAFKNFQKPVQAFNEMYRVLKTGETAWIHDQQHDVSSKEINNLVRHKLKARGFTAFFMKWIFISFLRKNACTKEQLKAFIDESAFENCRIIKKPA